MNENTKITFYLEDLRAKELLREETRTLKEWTGLTDESMSGWSVMHLERVLGQVRQDWTRAHIASGWKIVQNPEED